MAYVSKNKKYNNFRHRNAMLMLFVWAQLERARDQPPAII